MTHGVLYRKLNVLEMELRNSDGASYFAFIER